jgi:hypothetical protein
MNDAGRRLFEDARRHLADATSELSRAVATLEGGAAETTEVMELLGEAMSRLRILDGEIERYLAGENPEARSTGSAPHPG